MAVLKPRVCIQYLGPECRKGRAQERSGTPLIADDMLKQVQATGQKQ